MTLLRKMGSFFLCSVTVVVVCIVTRFSKVRNFINCEDEPEEDFQANMIGKSFIGLKIFYIHTTEFWGH